MQSIVEDYDDNKKQKDDVLSTELSSNTSSLLKVQSSYDYLRSIGVSFKYISMMEKSPNIQFDKYYLNNSNILELFPAEGNFENMFLCLIDGDFGLGGSLSQDAAGSLQNQFGVTDEKRANKRQLSYERHEKFIKKLIENE